MFVRTKGLWLAAVMGISLVGGGFAYAHGSRNVVTSADARLEEEPAKMVLSVQGRLSANDARDRLRPNSFAKVYTVRLSAGKVYGIELTSRRGSGFFDTYVRIEDARGRALAENDDESPDTLDSFLEFEPRQSGTYRVVVTSFGAGATGSFRLNVTEVEDLTLPEPPDRLPEPPAGLPDVEIPR